MIFDDETKYWQEQYELGEIDDDDICGTVRALIDGSAVSMIIPAIIFTSILVTICHHFYG